MTLLGIILLSIDDNNVYVLTYLVCLFIFNLFFENISYCKKSENVKIPNRITKFNNKNCINNMV